MPKLTINGKEAELPAGTNLIEAAQTLGTEIPRFCYHPGLSVAGNCRMCLVEIEKAPKLQIACNTAATEGLVVLTDSDKVKKARAGVMEFLLLNHPIDCPICDCAGECYLQDYSYQYGRAQSRFEGSDRQGRGRVVAALRLGPLELEEVRRATGWSDDDRADRIWRGLVGEGLAVVGPDGCLRLA